ncbi:serine hydrolase-like protein isoform X2 [Stegodyphus dumicola]|nr:serine hydrolase-like protein isoform X2 [Stegodyphus dumicola]XP_035205684.1 serine hydrolase-like protein isoform X2 [Stegodyphus dumicola]XP_035205686.1 serine hydrolase-like protein isoform X2 [Stegodyphus dumicola]XP_035205687.1 serine hydrolase-like protein isoform X2 [Stegodyphus dumicola]XP_035205688.1 serine hydrolase-like protein isoform X2 [Stegodyphus dumicola]
MKLPKAVKNRRNMSTSQWSNLKELRIPVAYGHIAAKVWGEKQSHPVLALHGWQDNAGTFDTLIPLLTSKLYIVAFDAPGHGLSSHKPYGTFYHYMEMLIDIKRVVDYLKWEKFSIVGHSMGGTLALMYASIFPENVCNIVLLDIIKPASRSPERLPEVTRRGIESLLKYEAKIPNPTPVYSFEEAQERLLAGMYEEITLESANILLKRGCRPSDCGKGVVFSRDIRVKATEELQKLSHEDLKAFMCRLKCNLLIILGKNSKIFLSRTPEVLEEFLNIYRHNCKNFDLVKVEGNHFVHLNHPDRVAPYIDKFFKMHISEISKL